MNLSPRQTKLLRVLRSIRTWGNSVCHARDYTHSTPQRQYEEWLAFVCAIVGDGDGVRSAIELIEADPPQGPRYECRSDTRTLVSMEKRKLVERYSINHVTVWTAVPMLVQLSLPFREALEDARRTS